MAVRIGELLLKEKRITPAQLQEALNYQKQHGGKLGYNLVKLGFVKDEEITALLSKQYGVPSKSIPASSSWCPPIRRTSIKSSRSLARERR
jgi:type IV pilus assembly protein PilB